MVPLAKANGSRSTRLKATSSSPWPAYGWTLAIIKVRTAHVGRIRRGPLTATAFVTRRVSDYLAALKSTATIPLPSLA